MSQTQSQTRGGPDFLFPLSRYARTEAVAAELAALGRLPRRRILARAAEASAGRDGPLSREALTALVRGFVRAGDSEAADAVLDALLRRVRPALTARAAAWRTLSPVDFEDAAAEAMLTLAGFVRATGPTEELWECNFATCFKLRMDSVFLRAARRRRPTSPLTAIGADGEARDLLAETPDPRGEEPFADLEAGAVRQALIRAVPGLGEYLFFSDAGYSDAEIAARLSVSDRTLRNWKAKGREFLTRRGEP